MNNPRNTLIIGGVVVVLAFIYACAYVVNEAQQVVITQFGEPIGEPILEPGIHFKLPYPIQKANFFEKRFLAWDGDRDQIPTKDGRFIWVDTYARWRIADPLLFLQRVTDERGAQSRLDDILDSETKSAIARYDLVEVIRSTNEHVKQMDRQTEDIGTSEMVEISIGRSQITNEIITACAPKTMELGIELLDLQVKRIKFKEEVEQSVFDRMISERRRIAEKYRSEGQGEASRTLGRKERDLLEIQSEAYKEAETLKGTADAKATQIYASAYDRNADSREFYRFLKTMESYQVTLTDKDWLILTTKSDFFKYLRDQYPR